MDRSELLTLLPAYALDALDADERAEVEALLETDTEAQALLVEYRAASDQLAVLAPPRCAPDRLQADLRQRLAASRAATPPPLAAVPAAPARRSGRMPLRSRLALAAVVAVVLLGAIVVGLVLTNDSVSAPGPAELYARLRTERGASTYAVVPGEVSDALWGDVVVSRDGKRAVLRVDDLPAIGADQVFQMWLIDASGARTSGGLFHVDSAKTVYVMVPFKQPIADYQAVGVSLEPEGGSPYADQPTGPRVLSVPLS